MVFTLKRPRLERRNSRQAPVPELSPRPTQDRLDWEENQLNPVLSTGLWVALIVLTAAWVTLIVSLLLR